MPGPMSSSEKISKHSTTPAELEPYKENLEYLADQFERIALLREAVDDPDDLGFGLSRYRRTFRRRKSSRSGKNSILGKIEKLEQRIAARLQKTDRSFPLEELKKRKNLDRKEELIIVALLERETSGRSGCDRDDLLDLLSQTRYEMLTDKRLFEKDARLVKEKMIETDRRRRRRLLGDDDDGQIRLNPSLKATLLEEKRGRNLRTALKEETFFEVVLPSVPFEKVILHPKTYEDISLVIEMIRGEVPRVLAGWGISGSGLVHDKTRKKREQPATLLFYGPPGTGKTLTANALAYSLKRRLLTLDCSKILSCWVGESEQNTRKIFDRYREIAQGMKTPPVLLLNEADQFLHRRGHANRSADHMYNQMQNIFLEQLERFPGILMATTNLVENLDPAFSRRFHFKIEFRRPLPAERHRLWQTHIPDKLPMGPDVNLESLAARYDLSGGQIAVVVRNAAVRAARRGDGLHQEDLIMACEDEVKGNFDKDARRMVGF